MPTHRFWVWCEVICSNCNTQLCGEFTSQRIPKAEFEKEIKDKGGIIDGKEVFCSEKCKEVYKTRVFRKQQGTGS